MHALNSPHTAWLVLTETSIGSMKPTITELPQIANYSYRNQKLCLAQILW
jgi:hypothetical protein